MNENSEIPKNTLNIWIRGLFMLLMALAYHVCGTVLCVVTVIQFVVVLVNGTPNIRLVSFGRSLARYIQQTANFLIFVTEEKPFPFNDWPADD